MHEDHGLQPDGALEAKVVLSDTALFNRDGGEMFVGGLLERVRAMPGVLHAGFGTNLPPRPPPATIQVRFISGSRDELRLLNVGLATPGYLQALGARLVAGRDFSEADAQGGAAGIILSESAARFYFPGEDPVGRTVSPLPAIFGMTARPRVIGVVGDMKSAGLDSPAASSVYIPWSLRPFGRGYLIVRAVGDPMRLAPDIRRAAQVLDPTVPIPELQSLNDALTQSIADRRIRALPAIGFGLLALAVALVGLLATLSTLVEERRRDLAIRSALGASPRQLIWTIVGPGVALTAAGVLLGMALGGAAARGLAFLLYGVSPFDAMTFGGTALVIAGGAILTTYLAALPARSVNPLTVLREG